MAQGFLNALVRELKLKVLCEINVARVNERGDGVEGRIIISRRFAKTHGADHRTLGVAHNVAEVRADEPQAFHIEGVMFQIRNVNGAMPFPEDRGWKDTVWVDGQVELLVYFGQPSWAHFPFYFNSQTLEMADRGSIGQLLVNPVP